jgi:hypothetical protein
MRTLTTPSVAVEILRWLIAAAIVLASALVAAAQVKGPIVGTAERSDTSKPLRELAKEAAAQEQNLNYGLGKELDKPAQTLVDFLKKEHPAAAQGQLSPLADDAVAKCFPETAFYVLRFRQYPIAFEVPKGLSARNVCAVHDAKATLLTSGKEFEAFAIKHSAAAAKESEQRQALAAWLRLSEELHQDGFYKFAAVEPDTFKYVRGENNALTGQANVVAQGGNSGHISGTLIFDTAGKLLHATAAAKLTEGIRPICQATRLLDADPLIRRMAHRDLLVLGRPALPYLLEQHSKASEELRVEIEEVWGQILAEGR